MKIDRIYKHLVTGAYSNEFGEQLDIEEVFKNGDLHVFSGDYHPLIVAQWSTNMAAWFVVSEYRMEKTAKDRINGKERATIF